MINFLTDIIASARLKFRAAQSASNKPASSYFSHHVFTSTQYLLVYSFTMTAELNERNLEQAFDGRADIQAAIRAAAGMSLIRSLLCGPLPSSCVFRSKFLGWILLILDFQLRDQLISNSSTISPSTSAPSHRHATQSPLPKSAV